jgi:hypothetical protein
MANDKKGQPNRAPELHGMTVVFSFESLQPAGSIIFVSKNGTVEMQAHKIPAKNVFQILQKAVDKLKSLE